MAIDINDSSQIHGFVNQAFLYSPDNPYAGTDSKNGSLKFRELGVNGFTELTPEFRLAAQVLSRQQDEADDGDVRVDFLLADYLVFSGQSASFGIRAGRVKTISASTMRSGTFRRPVLATTCRTPFISMHSETLCYPSMA